MKRKISGPEKRQPFGNRMEVLRYLEAMDYKIQKSKLYGDAATGILRCNKNGTVDQDAVQAYINDPRSNLTVSIDAGLKDLAAQKLQKEVEKLTEQVKTLQFQRKKIEGNHITIEEYEIQIASRAAVFEAMLRQAFEAAVDKMIVAGALPGAQRRAMTELLNDSLTDALDRYVSADEITITME